MKRIAVAMVGLLLGLHSASAARKNIIVVLTDDQRTESFRYMPFLNSIKSQGRVFDRYYHTEALCAPSRASMLTGMYPHNHEVLDILGPDGGYPKFMARGLDRRTWAARLAKLGYDTAMLGKFMNDIPVGDTTVPIGWSEWFATYANYAANDYEVNANGHVAFFGDGDVNYLTNVIDRRARAVIRRAASAGRPFAILFSPHCPHMPATPAQAYLGVYAREPFTIAQKPSFNETDVSDKPAHIRALPPLSEVQVNTIAQGWRTQLECARSIDDAMRRIWRELETSTQLQNTYIFVATDNGFMRGEHRIRKGKVVPYRESIESKLFVFGPDVTPGISRKIVANIDLMPTILDLAGFAQAPVWVDGRSLRPLFRGNAVPWRKGLLIHGRPGSRDEESIIDPAGELFLAYVTSAYIYVKYAASTDREFYDHRTDPYQISNGFAQLSGAFVTAVEDRIDQLYACAAAACRTIEDVAAPRP